MDFEREFESQCVNIEHEISSGNPDVDKLLRSVDDVQTQVKKHLGQISTYEREKYDARLQSLRDKVWKLKRPRRFQFKSRGALKRPDAEQPESSPLPATPTKRDRISEAVIFEPEVKPNLNLADLNRTVIVLGNISGALHLTRVTNSIVLAKCSQCRIHDSVNIKLRLEGCRNPVIENSSAVTFEFPEPEEVKVSDFSWMRSEPSPNFTVCRAPVDSTPVQAVSRAAAEELHAALPKR